MPREAYYIATKVARYELDYENMFDFSARKTRESVEKSLQLLGLEYVDVIQIHDVEFAENLDIVLNETLPALEQLVKEGKAKFIGLSAYPLSVLKECITRAEGRFDVSSTIYPMKICSFYPIVILIPRLCSHTHAIRSWTTPWSTTWTSSSPRIWASFVQLPMHWAC